MLIGQKNLTKKVLASLMSLIMALAILMPSSYLSTVYAETSTITAQQSTLKVSNNLISITEARNIDVNVNFGYKVDPKNLVWSFGGKSFSDWKKWDSKAGDFKGNTFITFEKNPAANGNEVNATIKFDLPFDTVDVNPRSYRVQYPKLLGNYDLQVMDTTTGKFFTTSMKINVYDDFHSYAEFKPALDNIKANLKSDRYMSIESLGKSTGGRDMYFVVVAKDKASVDKYLDQVQQAYNDPASLQKKIQDKNGKDKDFKVAVWFNNVHPDEAPGPDAIIKLISDFATQDKITYKNKKVDKASNSPVYTDIDVKKVLDNEILLFNLTTNPDGRAINTRQNLNGIDLNRDYSYQTQVETRNFAKGMNKWAPLTVIDYHGFYPEMAIEPCTGPHNPNYEYDLLMDGMIPQAYAMAKAAVANTKYLSADIPQLDFYDSFDDATPCYTSTYAMFQGALGHTFEIPELNEDSFKALVSGGYASINYVNQYKIKLFTNQLEMYRRQVNNEDNKEVDRYYTDYAGYQIGRPRGENTNFFPEYYAIPVDKSIQKNSSEAEKMAEALLNNGVKVQRLTNSVVVGDITYPTGTYIVPMHQAKRDYANVLLYKGFDASDWQVMYAEIVNDFPNLRGFDSYEIRTPGVFDKYVEKVDNVVKLGTPITVATEQVVVKNNSNESVQAVNKLLNSGKSVKMVTAAANGYSIGDYIVAKADLETIKSDYTLNISAVNQEPTAKTIKPAKVYITKSTSLNYKGQLTNQTGFVLQELGFTLVDKISDADVVVDNVGVTSVKDYVQSGKPYIGIGSPAINSIVKEKLIKDFELSKDTGVGNYYEGALKSVITQNNIITGGYNDNEVLYCTDGEYITKAPQDAEILAKVSNTDDFYLSGWWPGHEKAKGQVLAFQYNNMVIFANDVTNKAHPSNQFRLLSNAIYSFQVNK